ncbi:MAG: hypothetical protein ACP5HX_02075 [Thermoproteota archaeon]
MAIAKSLVPCVNETHGMGNCDAPEPADEVGCIKHQLNAGTSCHMACFQQNWPDGDG